MKTLKMRTILAQALLIASSITSADGNAAAQTAHDALARLAAYMPQSRDAEIALARSAAPASLSSGANILVLGATGYEVQSRGNNGFVCFVERSWAKEPGDPEFWNPKVRAAMCMNPAAARSVLPIYLEKTKLVLAGSTETEVRDHIQQSVETGKFSPPQVGAMSYMMSKQQYINDGGQAWRPHLMFYFPLSFASGSWGADLDDSPVLSDASARLEHLIVFVVPTGRWSDGSPAAIFPPAAAHRQQ